MQYKLHSFLALAAIGLGSFSVNAQTVASFDDLTLPSSDTSFLEVLPAVDGVYPFETGNTRFYGIKGWGGGYQAQFNYSNRTDTVTPGYENMWAAITGAGVDNSANYGITYAESDPMNYYKSLETGPKLINAAAGSKVAGVYVTNTTYAYRYIQDNYVVGDSLGLTVRGYINNVKTEDSVTLMLAKYGASDTILVNTWQWVNLLPLGDVDSLTFQLTTTDDYTPMYFAIDNLTTLDGECPQATAITAVSINENSATINWTNSVTGIDVDYEVAVDQSATLAPTATAVAVTSATFNATSLQENTVYYVHVRSTCDAGFSDWDTASFKTLAGTGLFDKNTAGLSVSISPNPAQDVLHINAATVVNAEIYNLEGKRLMSVTKAKDINIAALPAGLYMLRVIDEKGKEHNTLRFSKKN